MSYKTQVCVIGTDAGGGMVAFQLAKAGLDVVVVNSGKLPSQKCFDNELSPEAKRTFDIKPNMTFPARAHIDLSHPLFAAANERSICAAHEETFSQYQVHHVSGLQNL